MPPMANVPMKPFTQPELQKARGISRHPVPIEQRKILMKASVFLKIPKETEKSEKKRKTK